MIPSFKQIIKCVSNAHYLVIIKSFSWFFNKTYFLDKVADSALDFLDDMKIINLVTNNSNKLLPMILEGFEKQENHWNKYEKMSIWFVYNKNYLFLRDITKFKNDLLNYYIEIKKKEEIVKNKRKVIENIENNLSSLSNLTIKI